MFPVLGWSGRNKVQLPRVARVLSNDSLIASSNQSDTEIRLAIRKLPVIGKQGAGNKRSNVTVEEGGREL